MRSNDIRAPQSAQPVQLFVTTAESSADEPPQLFSNGSPAQIRQFLILQQLGAGGMGTVYAAYDTKLDRKVALKVLHRTHRPNRTSEPSPALLASQAQREQTLHEAKALARVNHPHVVNIYEVTEADDAVCLAMEFVDGITLRAWQLARPRTWREVLDMYLQAGRGLSAVHAAGVVHRDFKPDNVLVGRDGRPRVADFGIARLRQEQLGEVPSHYPASADSGAAAAFTFQGICFGTPGYMPPEQYDGGNVDTASDQFSFCAAMFEALYGYLPFAGISAAEQRRSIDGPVRPPPSTASVPVEIHHILLRGLSVQPSARFPSLDALLAALAVEHQQTISAAAWSRRRIVFTLVASLFTGWFSMHRAAAHFARIAAPALVVSVVVLSTMLGAGYWHRRALISNVFHRRIWTLLTMIVLQNLLLRLGAALKPAAPFFVYYTAEMVLLAGSTMTIGLLFLRSVLWLPVLPLTLGVLTWLELNISRSLQVAVYPIVFFSILWGWHRAADRGLTNGSD